MTTDGRRSRSEPPSPELLAERALFRTVIREIVRDGRKTDGLTQEQLGRRVGVSRWTISQLELGNISVGFDVIFGIFRAVVRLHDLFEMLDERFTIHWEPPPEKIPRHTR